MHLAVSDCASGRMESGPKALGEGYSAVCLSYLTLIAGSGMIRISRYDIEFSSVRMSFEMSLCKEPSANIDCRYTLMPKYSIPVHLVE